MADDSGASRHKRAKLFMHGGSQAVRLPKEFRFQGAEVVIRKEGDSVILEPVKRDWRAARAWLFRELSGTDMTGTNNGPPTLETG